MARLSIALIGIAAVLAAATSAEERTLALAPHVVEVLYAIGAESQIVGAVRYADYPPAAQALPHVGSYRAIAVESALRLRPTLAIALDRSVGGIDQLEAMGVRVEFSHPWSVRETIADIERLGRLVGRPAPALALATELRQRLAKLAASRPEKPVRVFYELWFDPLMTVGRGSFLNDALTEIGAENVFAALPFESPQVNIESVLRAAPDVIVIPGEARDVAKRARQWRDWFSHRRIQTVEAPHDLLHRPGPRLLDGMEQLQAALLQATALGEGVGQP